MVTSESLFPQSQKPRKYYSPARKNGPDGIAVRVSIVVRSRGFTGAEPCGSRGHWVVREVQRSGVTNWVIGGDAVDPKRVLLHELCTSNMRSSMLNVKLW